MNMTNDPFSHAALTQIYLRNKGEFSKHFDSRMRRSLSWLGRAEKEMRDPHAGFIFYWISFNAIYSGPFEDIGRVDPKKRKDESKKRKEFFQLVLECDRENIIRNLLWEKRRSVIDDLLNNQFIYSGFWKVGDPVNDLSWKGAFEEDQKYIEEYLAAKNTLRVLRLLFTRLNTLRNQLVHGNATWDGERNRSQVEHGFEIISHLQGMFLFIMLNNPKRNWGEVAYDLYPKGFDDFQNPL